MTDAPLTYSRPVHYAYRPALDGVRTLAVYLVLLFHTGMAWMAGGFVGVDVFFVLSGFLVTHVLLSEADSSGTIDLGRFYARRVRRLLPAALVVVVATCAVWTLVLSVVRRLQLVGDAQSALLYVANWRFLAQQQDYFASEVDQSPFLHFWSLAIEEQYYVLYPALLVVSSPPPAGGRQQCRWHWPPACWPRSRRRSSGTSATPTTPTSAPTPGSTSSSRGRSSPCCSATGASPSRADAGRVGSGSSVWSSSARDCWTSPPPGAAWP